MTILFRAMKADSDGLPLCDRTHRTLGAIPGAPRNGDLPVTADGKVRPGTGGMSVTRDDPKELPKHCKPKWLRGDGRDPLFRIFSDEIPDTLALRPDHDYHVLVEPAQVCRFEEYEKNLHGTRHRWEEVTA